MNFEALKAAARVAVATASPDKTQRIYLAVFNAQAAIAEGTDEDEACATAIREIESE
jgi:hypothetical protein